MAPPKKLPKERDQGQVALEAYFCVKRRKGRPKRDTLPSDVAASLAKQTVQTANLATPVSKKREAATAVTASSSKEKKQKKTGAVPRINWGRGENLEKMKKAHERWNMLLGSQWRATESSTVFKCCWDPI
jgi:hypothetical protein